MPKNYLLFDLSQVKTYPLSSRKSKVGVDAFAAVPKPGGSFAGFMNALPDILAAKNLKEIVSRIVTARKSGRPVILGMGAHPIKVGLNPLIIHLMEREIINALALNGACIVHDTELAMIGQTSEDVDAEIGGGAFGMAEETGRVVNESIKRGHANCIGLGEAVGQAIVAGNYTYTNQSLLAAGYRLGVPVTVHVAMGTDIVHMHPAADGAAIGATSHTDFRKFASIVADLEGGVYINLGSAVIMPEVFLKALTLVRNVGHQVKDFTTVNMDFIQGYRPNTNVVRRPTMTGGKGYSLTGHHEIMFPLLVAAVLEELDNG